MSLNSHRASSHVYVCVLITGRQDERSQVLTTNVFIDQTWHDENLLWEPAEHNNISSLRIPEQRVWLPDTFLFNK